ncbi:MAG TPA: hypothetical protein VKT54_13870 [Steroidobacteraceae bacterium]|nr:hypothetical protein [Steroidobacteraceae bacterium]
MSSVAYQQLSGGLSGVVLQWPAIPASTTGAPTPTRASIPYVSASFQASGTFGSGGSVQIEGSNDGVNFYKLSPAALTAPGAFASLGAQEQPRYLRPNCTAGDGTTAITVSAFLAC